MYLLIFTFSGVFVYNIHVPLRSSLSIDFVMYGQIHFIDDNFSILVLNRTGAENYINITLNCIRSRHNNQT